MRLTRRDVLAIAQPADKVEVAGWLAGAPRPPGKGGLVLFRPGARVSLGGSSCIKPLQRDGIFQVLWSLDVQGILQCQILG